MWLPHSVSRCTFLFCTPAIKALPVFPRSVLPYWISRVGPTVAKRTRWVVWRWLIPCLATAYFAFAIPTCTKSIVCASFGWIREDVICGDDQAISFYPDFLRQRIICAVVSIRMIYFDQVVESGLGVYGACLHLEDLIWRRMWLAFWRHRPRMLFASILLLSTLRAIVSYRCIAFASILTPCALSCALVLPLQ